MAKYAELLNLLDQKEVFSYKTSSNQAQLTTNPISLAQQLGGASQSPVSQLVSGSVSSIQQRPMLAAAVAARENLDDPIWLFHKFKSSFYDLVYKFPHSHLLKVFLNWS